MATTDLDNDGVNDAIMSKRQKQLNEATLIPSEIQSLSPDAIIELFELDLSKWEGNSNHNCYFHAGTNGISQPVVWRGKKYDALPIEAEGFEATTQGTLPRPKLRLANLKGLFSAGVREMDDFVGCKIIRRRTFKKFLDPNNFTVVDKDELGVYRHIYYTNPDIINRDGDGNVIDDHNIYINPDTWSPSKITANDKYPVSYKNISGATVTVQVPSPYLYNPTYDPYQHYPDEVWYIEQKISETKWLIEWELSSPLDLQGVQLPRRQIIQNTCCWKYCSAECGWAPFRASTGRYYNKNNEKTTSIKEDVCAKRLSSCEVRFVGTGKPIPFGGFPGAVRYNQ